MTSANLSATRHGLPDIEKAIETAFGTDPFTLAQAELMGVTRDQLKRLVRAGTVSSVLFGVYRLGMGDLDLAGRAQAAGLVLPPDGAIARRTAAWMLGMDPRSPDQRQTILDVECIVDDARIPLRRDGLRCFAADLRPTDVTRVGGVVCTTPTRTSADLLRWISPPMGLAVSDAMAAAKLIDPQMVLKMLERWPGHRFVAQARRLAAWIEPLTESYGETWLRLRILEAGFPRPTAQVEIQDDAGRTVYRLDLGWPEFKIGIEYDGREFHSSRAQLQADQQRRDRLAVEFGWHVIGVSLGDVLGRSLRLESGIGELLGLEPKILRRTW